MSLGQRRLNLTVYEGVRVDRRIRRTKVKAVSRELDPLRFPREANFSVTAAKGIYQTHLGFSSYQSSLLKRYRDVSK